MSAMSALSTPGNVLIQADTGSGKTRVLVAIAEQYDNVLIIAHRNALVAQLSLEFAKAGLCHGMLAAKATIRRTAVLHRRKLGKSLLSANTSRFVCSIDTIISKARRNELAIDTDEEWLIVFDECHHAVEENKWGNLLNLFKNCRVVGATATPSRLDGVPLRKGKGGIFDSLIQAKSLKENSVETLIKQGFLSPFKCYGIESRLDDNALKLGKHDYTNESLIRETKKHVQQMAGDAVEHYKRLADKKQAVAFCVSIEIAKQTADAFKKAGVSAAAIHSKMSRTEIDSIFDLFESKQIQVLCNVDMTGEGVDIPAIEALIMLRKTASLTLYRQWVGRSLRPCVGKEYAIIIDHADNIRKHGLPDKPINWSLDGPPAEQKSNLVECEKCGFLFKAWEKACPECGELLLSNSGQGKDVKYIDTQLVEVYKTTQAMESRNNAIAATIHCDEIRYLRAHGSKIAEMTTRIAKWFFENVKEHVTRGQIEEFFFRHNNMQFWATYFTLAELSRPNQKKCLRIFNETQRHMR